MKSTTKCTGLIVMIGLIGAIVLGLGGNVVYATEGDLDTSFSGDGLVTTNFIDTPDEARALAIQPDGKIVAAGYTHRSGTNNDFSVARYNPDGSPDTSFSGNGHLTTAFGGTTDDQAYAVAIQPDGQIVVAGTTGPWYSYGIYQFAVARYNPDGTLDATFSGDGRFYWYFGDYGDDPETAVARAVAIQPDGKIVLAGFTTYGGPANFALMRLTATGTLDESFDGDGLLTTNFFGGTDEVRAMSIQSDGKIVAAGNAQVNGSDYDFAMARYNPNGSLDTSFDGDGKATTDFFGGGDDGAYALALQPDGKIVAAGHSWNVSGGYDFGFARYLSNGDLDTGFDIDGKQVVGFVAGVNTEVALGAALQADGKIVVAGYAPINGVNDFALTRLTPDGALDYAFGGGDGIVNNDFGGGVAIANAVALQADGRIVAAGTAYMGEPHSYDYALARYLSGLEPPPTSTPIPTSTNTRQPTQTPGGPTATPQSTPTPCPIQFPDVPPGSTFYDFVRCLACRGIINGFPDNTFRPNNLVTRGQLSKIVSNSAGFADPQPNQMFEDVPLGSTFHDVIGRLASRGYISGYSCGGANEPCVAPNNLPYFRPDNDATRGQISKIVSNAAGFNDPALGQTFEDVPPASAFYTFIQRLTSRYIMQGYACGGANEPCIPPENRPYFRPNNNATRGQTSKIVSNTFFLSCQTPGKRIK